MLPFDLKKAATTREARAHAGLTKAQWVKFYKTTKIEADKLLEIDPDLNWPSIPDDMLAEIHARVNDRLAQHKVPTVRYDVFTWRMARAIQNLTAPKAKAGGKSVDAATILASMA